ncbi:MAG: hypothetical protein WCS79_04755 [Paludibacter sp.]|jgi:hypothetical protein
MLITKENNEAIIEWLSSKCGQMRCTCCGESKLSIGEISTLQIGYDLDTTRFHYHQGMPLISIYCVNCGYVMQFSSSVIGIKPKPVPEEQIPEPQKE